MFQNVSKNMHNLLVMALDKICLVPHTKYTVGLQHIADILYDKNLAVNYLNSTIPDMGSASQIFSESNTAKCNA